MDNQANTDSKLGGDREVLAQRLRKAVDQAIAGMPDELVDYALSGRDEIDVVRKALGHDKQAIGKDEEADLRSIVAIRAVRGAFNAARKASVEQVMSAVIASTDIEVMSELLGRDTLAAVLAERDPDTSTVAMTLAKRSALQAKAGELLSAPQVGEMLGISRQAVDKRRRSSKLLALRVASDWRYPAIQFFGGATATPMEWILQAYAGRDPWEVLEILMEAREEYESQSLVELVHKDDVNAILGHIDLYASG